MSEIFGAAWKSFGLVTGNENDVRISLANKAKEVEVLKAEVALREKQNQELIAAQKRYQDAIETNEAAISQARNSHFKKEAAGGQDAKRIGELEETVRNLTREVERLKCCARANPFLPDTDEEQYHRYESPKEFHSRLQKMVAGESIQVWDKDRFQPTHVFLSADYKTVNFSTAPKKPPNKTGLVF